MLPGSGDLELLVTEVGDELEGAAEGGDEPAQHVLGGDVTALDLGDSRDGHPHPDGDLLLGQPAFSAQADKLTTEKSALYNRSPVIGHTKQLSLL